VPWRLVASSEFAEIWQTLFGSSREKKHSRARNRITHLSGVDYMRDSEAFFQSRLEQIRAEGRYRTFTDFKRRVGVYTLARKCDAGNLGSTKAGARSLALILMSAPPDQPATSIRFPRIDRSGRTVSAPSDLD
jgi:hypothetical protein